MDDRLKFFSQEWCDSALKVCNQNREILEGFEEPIEFTYRMRFVCTDKGMGSELDWDEGVLTSWGPSNGPEREVDLVLAADLETWRSAAEGRESGAALLARGKLRITKGPLQVALSNGDALEAFLKTLGTVSTDWQV